MSFEDEARDDTENVHLSRRMGFVLGESEPVGSSMLVGGVNMEDI